MLSKVGSFHHKDLLCNDHANRSNRSIKSVVELRRKYVRSNFFIVYIYVCMEEQRNMVKKLCLLTTSSLSMQPFLGKW